MRFSYKLITVVFLVFILTRCARKGRPEGGPKDETAPVMVIAKPPYRSINFSKNEIKIYFDEYIVLKDLNKELIVSPPLKNPAIISPQGTPSKYIKIKILDTLKTNTTYTFNFGNAVQDNNENNKLESFKYIFSTGSFIDSLKIKGSVTDALEGKLKKNISIMLYKLNSTYNDSVPFKRKPDYVSSTLDSVKFQFTNIQEGKYKIVALDEEVKDYIFNPKKDKIGFLPNFITLPKDSLIGKQITLFKETKPFKFKRGKEVFKGKIQFGFEGTQKGLTIKLITKVPKNFKDFQQYKKDSDTLNYWFTPIVKDSLKFIVSKDNFIDTIKVRLQKKNIDSLSISSVINKTLHLNDTLFLTANNPITKIDTTKFSLTDKDTTNVSFKLLKQKINKIALLFKKTPKNKYALSVLPDAITDLYKMSNDSLFYNFITKDPEDYGTISLNIKNKINKPLIIELIENKKVIKTQFVKGSEKISFTLLEPKKYSIRAIIDGNDNKKWDTGNFLHQIQPERIVYFGKEIELRPNWVFNEVFVIK